MDTTLADTLIKLMAAWLLLFGAALWAGREQLGLSQRMLMASFRGLLQLLALSFILHWVFDLQSYWTQALLILFFCILAAHTSASHHHQNKSAAWRAASVGLACACAVTLPWLAISHAVDANARTLIPLGSMIAANGMNAISLMFNRMADANHTADSLRSAMIPPVDTLRMAGLVHMPGIFVGMVLAGATPLAAASAQLIVLYMIVASSFIACMVSFLMLNHYTKSCA